MKRSPLHARTHTFGLLLAPMAGVVLLTLMIGSSAIAGDGNSANARLCQQHGWMGQIRTDGTTFTSVGDCVSYAAHGGRLVPFTGCFVLDTNQVNNYSNVSLGTVVAAAAVNDSLVVNGTCTGSTTLDRNLIVTGQASTGYSTPTLQGHAEHVLIVNGGIVTVLNTLTITGGHTVMSVGGGILNFGGDVTLNDCTVSGNSSRSGGGIWNEGTLTLNGNTSISGNHTETPLSTPAVSGEGGGVTNGGTLKLNDSSSISNNASGAGGGLFFLGGAVTLNDSSSIDNNTASTVDGRGGGIFVGGSGLITTLNGSSSIDNNLAAQGGGVYNYCSSFVVLNDLSDITGNTASLPLGGGGIFNAGSVTPPGGGSHVHDNFSPGFPTINNIVDSATCDLP